TTGTSSGARSPSPACSAASASFTTWPGSAAVPRRCWPSTRPGLRRSRSPTSPPDARPPGRGGHRGRPRVPAGVRRGGRGQAGPAAPAEPFSDPVQSQVATLIRTPPLLCQGSEPIREAARRMTDQGASAVLVPLSGSFGIVTDRDLRSRVIAAGLSPDEPVSAIMTAPAYTVTAGRLGGDVLLHMLERTAHHIPAPSAGGGGPGRRAGARPAAPASRKTS